MTNNRLLKKSGIYFIGSFSSKIMSAFLIPIYAFYINTEDLGAYDFAQTLMGILSPIIILAIWEAVLKFMLSEENPDTMQKIKSTSVIFSITLSMLFALIALIYEQNSSNQMRYFELVVLMIILHPLVLLWQYYARGTSSNKLFVVAGIASTIVNFIGVILFVMWLKLGLLGLLLAYNIGQLSTIIIIESKLKIIKEISLKNFDFEILKKLLLFSFPLVLNLTSAWFISGFGRTIITLRLGTEANGLYSFANKFSLIITMIGSVVTMAIIEEAILSVKSKKISNDFSKTLQNLFIIFQTIAIVSIPVIVVFYEIIRDTEFYDSLIFIPGLLFYAVMNTMASNIGSVFQAINKTKYQFTTTLQGGIATIVISLTLIDKLGILAIILGQVIGALVMLLSRYILINKFVAVQLNWKSIFIMTSLFITVSVITLNTQFFISILIEVIITLVILFNNKDILLKALQKFKK